MVEPVRTWTISFDNPFSNQLDQQVQYRESCFNIKDTYVNGGWTVIASSNGVVANLNDNWNSSADIVFASAGARSWIVMRSPVGWLPGTDQVELCMECNNSSPDATPQQMQSFFAANPFFDVTTPVTTARPTSGNETAANSSGDDVIPWTGVLTGRWTSWYSSRGDVVFGVKPQGVLQWRHFQVLTANTDVNGGGTGSYRFGFFSRSSSSTGVLTASDINNGNNWRGIAPDSVSTDSPQGESTVYGGAAVWASGLDVGGVTVSSPIDLYSNSPSRGRSLGTVVDFYAGPQNLPNGELDDAETLQVLRRQFFDSTWLYVPTALLPFA